MINNLKKKNKTKIFQLKLKIIIKCLKVLYLQIKKDKLNPLKILVIFNFFLYFDK